MFDRISVDANICHGQACIKGTRIPVHQIVGMLANGDNIENLLQAYPHIERADIQACLEYAATLTEEQITPIEKAAG
ncbi:MAG TPA: DUF433 domain-containing protein [Pyrinomonadaceae bacterium]|nr:DUF433 domain-containing protein [Pyrinomonadaceae bacterium]